MRVRFAWALILGAAFLFGAACGGDGEDPNAGVCPMTTDEIGEERADCADPRCSEHPSCVEICDDGVDNTGNGLVDCRDPLCAEEEICAGWICEGGSCFEACVAQSPDCTGVAQGGVPLGAICDQGRCVESAVTTKAGEIKTGELRTRTQLGSLAIRKEAMRSAVISVLHPERVDSAGTLNCLEVAALLRKEQRGLGASVNYAVRSAMPVEASQEATSLGMRLSQVPERKDGKPYVVTTQFYNGPYDGIADKVTGALVAFACAEGVGSGGGELNLLGQNACEPNQPETCPDGWSCLSGMCVYDCSLNCGSRETCRSVDGADVCLPRCPKDAPCPNGSVCDHSPPWDRDACVPKAD